MDASIGHVHLRVRDLARSTEFYRDVLGLQVTFDGRSKGLPLVLLAAGDYHHHVALNAFEPWDASSGAHSAGLHHFALLYGDRRALVAAGRRVTATGHTIVSGRDHLATVSLYLNDPDGIGIELYFDRPRELWFDANGDPVIVNTMFDVAEFLADADADDNRKEPRAA